MPADDWLRRFTDMEELDERGSASSTPRRAQAVSGDGVRVVVDESGAVRDVVVAADWRRSVRPDALGAALLASANEAIVAAVDFAVEPPAVHPRSDVEDAGGDPTSPVAQRLVGEILDLFGRFDADLTDYRERLRAATVAHTAVGMNRRLTVTLSSGLVESVEVDVHWAQRCRHTELGAEALSAFTSAQQADARARGDLRVPGSLARLRELGDDPWALCRQLGLTGGRTST